MRIITELSKECLLMLLINKKYGLGCTSEQIDNLLSYADKALDGNDIKSIATTIKKQTQTADSVKEIADEVLNYCCNYLVIA